jgi:hypothetical protein
MPRHRGLEFAIGDISGSNRSIDHETSCGGFEIAARAKIACKSRPLYVEVCGGKRLDCCTSG